MATLAEELSREGRTMAAVTAWAQARLDERWRSCWQAHLAEIESAYERLGEPAYGVYARELFRPVEDELRLANLTCEPMLPGAFPSSEERWGRWEERERRFWSVVRDGDGHALGTLVTRYFHDHTKLRIPRSPLVLALRETDREAITRAVLRVA